MRTILLALFLIALAALSPLQRPETTHRLRGGVVQ